MKYRSDFVTNSSSSSFILSMQFNLKNGKEVRFDAMGGSPESGCINYFEGDAVIAVSPKQLGTATTVDEMIALLEKGIVDDLYEDVTPIFQPGRITLGIDFDENGEYGERECCAYEFIDALREAIKNMDDIESIVIDGDEENYVSYRQHYEYNRETGKYTGRIVGYEFEKDGADGGRFELNDLDECDIEEVED